MDDFTIIGLKDLLGLTNFLGTFLTVEELKLTQLFIWNQLNYNQHELVDFLRVFLSPDQIHIWLQSIMDGLTVGQESKLITYAKTSPTIYQFMDSLSDRQMARVMNAILNSLTEEQVLKLVQHMILNLDTDQMAKLSEFLNLKSEYRALFVSV